MVGRFRLRYAGNMLFWRPRLIYSQNGARSAQAEHMILITESGADVLTE